MCVCVCVVSEAERWSLIRGPARPARGPTALWPWWWWRTLRISAADPSSTASLSLWHRDSLGIGWREGLCHVIRTWFLSLSFSSRPLFFRGRMFKAFSSSFFTCFYSNKQSRCHGFGSPPPRMMELLVNFCSLFLGYISIFLYIYIERSVLQWLLDYAAGCLWGFPFFFFFRTMTYS